ncbi:MAG: PAS domain S-box protein [Planctomycetes bacterium]|nr:PAS domain S-box protein [Planctomycetota bacterium]
MTKHIPHIPQSQSFPPEVFTAIVENSQNGVVVFREGKFLFVNKAFSNMAGVPAEQLIGKDFSEIIPPDEVENIYGNYKRLVESKLPVIAESYLLRNGTEKIHIEVNAALYGNGDDGMGYSIIRNISARVKAEEERSISEDRFRAVFDNAADYIYIKDREGRYTHANKKVCEALDLPIEEIKGKRDTDLLGEEHGKEAEEDDHKVLNGETVQIEGAREKNGVKGYFHLVKAPIRDKDGNITGICGIARDTTEQREAHDALINAERLAAVGTLAGGIAHEFNNINTVIQGYAEILMSRGNMDESGMKALERIHSAINRASSVTRNLLTFARPAPAQRMPSSLNDVVQGALKMVIREFETEGVKISITPHDIPDVVLDRNQLTQVLVNILINAGHAMTGAQEKILSIDTGQEKDCVYIRISDNGCGIPPENIDRLFLPFFTTKGEHAAPASPLSAVKGTGLGLSVCQSIMKQHGGSISVESEVDKGSTFTIKIPSAGQKKRRDSTTILSPFKKPESIRVLALDDEKDVLDLISTMLKQDGYEVATTDNGYEALRLFEEKPFDVILVDLQMPIMSGIDFMRKLRELEKGKGAAIIVATGKILDTSDNIYRSLNIYQTILKPFNWSTLRQSIVEAAHS